MVMTEACEPATMVGVDGRAVEKPVHDRMPAIPSTGSGQACRGEQPQADMPPACRNGCWADWLDGPPDAAGLLCRPYELGMRVERTGEAWVRR